MNRIEGTVSVIEQDYGISMITVLALGVPVSAMMIEATPASYSLQPGDPVMVTFKETAMSIGKNISGDLSIRNRFEGEITRMEKSKLLTKVILQVKGISLVSVITTGSAERLHLRIGDLVTGLVKTTDILLIKTSD